MWQPAVTSTQAAHPSCSYALLPFRPPGCPHLQRHRHVGAKHELQAADVALGAVGHKDLQERSGPTIKVCRIPVALPCGEVGQGWVPSRHVWRAAAAAGQQHTQLAWCSRGSRHQNPSTPKCSSQTVQTTTRCVPHWACGRPSRTGAGRWPHAAQACPAPHHTCSRARRGAQSGLQSHVTAAPQASKQPGSHCCSAQRGTAAALGWLAKCRVTTLLLCFRLGCQLGLQAR